MKILNDIKKGIETYKKVFEKKYKEIEKYIDIFSFIVAIGKIESNLKNTNKSIDKNSLAGVYQILKPTVIRTILSYSKKNLNKIIAMYKKSVISQTFVMMQLLFLNLMQLKKHNFKLCKEYEKFINKLPFLLYLWGIETL